jgi:hypothetical protein
MRFEDDPDLADRSAPVARHCDEATTAQLCVVAAHGT